MTRLLEDYFPIIILTALAIFFTPILMHFANWYVGIWASIIAGN